MKAIRLPIAVLVLLLAACSGDDQTGPSVQDYERKRAELAKRLPTLRQQTAKADQAEPAAEPGDGLQLSGDDFAYQKEGGRDPFRSFVLEQAQRMETHERGPLEQFDLNQLTVVAVVWGTQRPRALVEDPSGRGYIVQEGTPIGKNDGQILRIDDTTVLVRETYVDYLGERTSKEIEMRVRPTQGG